MRSGLQLLPVTDRVWCFRQRSYVCCSYAVLDAAGVVLVDAGMTSDAAPVLNGLALLDRAPADVHTILLTHWHNDHAAGAARLKTLSGASVHYHERERPYFTRRTARGGLLGWLSGQVPERGPLVLFRGLLSAATSTAIAADVLVRDGDLVLGQFRVVATPGHTPGHVAYFHEPTGVLFAGDALAVVGGKLRFMARPVTLDLETARASMAALVELPVRYVCPGHRRPLTEGVDEQLRSLEKRMLKTAWPLLG
ncbi:MBL fold metallo-hydrolase [Mycobacterium decipiens]|nr:MBL fold metallo-hydrolase [Mycobacterium decipiens]